MHLPISWMRVFVRQPSPMPCGQDRTFDPEQPSTASDNIVLKLSLSDNNIAA
jgi:hypothetical protein